MVGTIKRFLSEVGETLPSLYPISRAFGTAMCLCTSLFRGVAAPLGCVILVRMLIALLGGPVANFPALWYDKFNKLESVMH